MREFVCQSTGLTIDARAGLHVYFLIRALQTLAPKGRLAFIVSADICEGVFAPALWQWICSRYRLDAVITFAPEAAPFPDVDTNALVLLIRNTSPAQTFIWAKCKERNSSGLAALATNLSHKQYPGLQVYQRSLGEGLTTGLSRPVKLYSSRYTLSQFASVMRGSSRETMIFLYDICPRTRAGSIPDALLVWRRT